LINTALSLVFSACARLPLRVLHALGVLLGWLIWLTSPSYRRTLRANLAQAGYTDTALRRAAIAEAGKSVMELPFVWLRPIDDVMAKVKQVDGWEWIERAHADGRPVVFLTPHLGCFEITAQIYAARTRADKPITVLYRRPRKAALTELIETGRDRPNMRAVPADMTGVRKLIRALKNSEAAGLLPDQVPQAGEGVWADFFGRPAFTMTLVKRLVRTSNSRILLAHAMRLPHAQGYHMVIRPFDTVLDEDQTRAATQINHALEQLIRQCPAQYLWSYKRYKVPGGVAPPPDARAP
jgi:Kdo2-lipid IVA lauroyltransferase/acyltransferase